jgi:hypothetical protein
MDDSQICRDVMLSLDDCVETFIEANDLEDAQLNIVIEAVFAFSISLCCRLGGTKKEVKNTFKRCFDRYLLAVEFQQHLRDKGII